MSKTGAAILADALGENDVNQQVLSWISSGYEPINQVISGRYDGGFGVGRIYEVYGTESSGKTLIAQQAMIEAQKMGGIAMFVDWEKAFDVSLGEGFGLDTDPERWIYKAPDSFEEGCHIVKLAAEAIRGNDLIAPEAPICVVMDSLAMAIPKSQLEKEADEYTMNDTTALSRVTSTTLKVLQSQARKHNICIIILNQQREKPGVVYGDNTYTPGGNAINYVASSRIQLSRKQEKNKDDKSVETQVIGVKAVKTKHGRPGRSTSLRVNWNEDGSMNILKAQSLLEHGIQKSVLPGGKGRMELFGKKLYRAQMAQHIVDEGLIEELKEMVLV